MGIRESQSRRYPRSYNSRDRVAWSVGSGCPLRRGEVRDQSESGLGLLVDTATSPGPGAAIRVLGRKGTQLRRARVVRVVDHGPTKTLLGCRWISADPRPRHSPRPHRSNVPPATRSKGQHHENTADE